MTREVRASLRATGQIGILAIGVDLIVCAVALFIGDMVYGGHDSVESWQLIYTVSIVLGVVGLWASTQSDSNQRYRIAAVTAVSAMAVAMCAAVLAIYLDATPVLDWFLVISLAAGLVYPVGGLVCLAVSYRGQPLGLAEPSALWPRSPWLWMIVAPLAGLDVLLEWLARHYYFPESPVLGVFAGLPYGLMRQRNRVAGAGGWALATGRLLALMVPAYVVRLAAAVSAGNGLLLGRASIAMAVVVAILVTVAGFHMVGRRRYAPSGTQ